MRPSRRALTVGLLVLLGGGLGVALLRPAAVRVDVAPVIRGALQVTIDEDGETRVRDRYVVAAPVSGRLERIGRLENDAVEAGAVVARVHPLPLDRRAAAEARARLEAAEAEKRAADARVAQVQASLAQARRAAERARRLSRQGTISAEERELTDLAEATGARDLDAALFAADAADHNVEAARAVLLAAESAGGDGAAPSAGNGDKGPAIDIPSPARGRVLRVIEKSERVVGVGTPLLEIGDPASIEIVVDVLSADAVKVRPGARMVVEDWGGEAPLNARVRFVEPSGFTKVSALGVEEQRVNVVADFVDAPGTLADGYRLEARIVVWEADDVLKVPTSALFRRDGKWCVFVVEGGRARVRAVDVEHRNPLEAEVGGGLTAGERVVLHPSDLVDDGVRIVTS